jgi:hypothetical protein
MIHATEQPHLTCKSDLKIVDHVLYRSRPTQMGRKLEPRRLRTPDGETRNHKADTLLPQFL